MSKTSTELMRKAMGYQLAAANAKKKKMKNQKKNQKKNQNQKN